MHPGVVQEEPGMCPECGMNLVPVPGDAKNNSRRSGKHKSATDKHAGHSTNIFARKFWLTLLLTIPVVLYSPLPAVFFGWSPPSFPGSSLLTPLLGTVIFAYGGWVFVAGAAREIKGKAPGMMTLISLAIITAYAYSMVQTLRGQTETLFWELSTLVVIMLLGHWMEMRAVSSARGALKELSKLLPDVAEVERDGKQQTIALEQLRKGDVVVVRPGGKIAADGEVVDGVSDVNEALATGESMPQPKKIGSQVIAGTINGDGALKVRVGKIGDDTFLAGVMRLVQDAQASKSALQLLSDKAAFYLTIIAIAAGLLTLLLWLPTRGADFAFTRTVAVLVVACPHALGLAIPLVASISTNLAARAGFLVRQRLALEAARNIDVVLFDKTGTLTKGEYGVLAVLPAAGLQEKEILRLAAAIEAKSEHPVSQAIVKHAGKLGIIPPIVSQFHRLPGRGVSGIVDGKEIKAGGAALLSESQATVPRDLEHRIATEGKSGKTIIYVLKETQLTGVIVLGDVIREESRQAVELLKRQGIQVAMISGDAKAVAAWVADELGIDQFFAEVLPEHKADKVRQLQQQGKKVVMVGDGVNDAPALTQADVGVAIGAGTNVAVESAGIVLVKNDPRDIPKIINLSRRTYRKMIQNLFWATGYNVAALPLAAGAALAWGIVLSPAASAVLMSLSTIIVAMNAMLLRRSAGELGAA